MVKIGIIGGSGLDNPDILEDVEELDIDTPFGKPSSRLKVGKIKGVDVVYQDIAQKNQVRIFLKNVEMFLRNNGVGVLAIKARSIDVTKNPRKIFEEVRRELEKHLKVIDFKVLDPFEKDHCIFIIKKR